MLLFQRLQAKDVFEAFYRAALSKRLLLGEYHFIFPLCSVQFQI